MSANGARFWQICAVRRSNAGRGTVNRRHAAEFPNDNPELHDGTLWICLEVCSAPRPTRCRVRTAYSALIAPPSAELECRRTFTSRRRSVKCRRSSGDRFGAAVELASLVPPIEASVELVAARPGLAKALPESDPFQRFVPGGHGRCRKALRERISRRKPISPALLERGTTRPATLWIPAGA